MRKFAPVLALLILGATASVATAQPYRAREGVESGRVRSLDQILNGIRRERPGSLSDVQGPNAGPQGEPRYRLKWLTPDGRVLWLDTDARTGRVLGVEGEDRGPPPGAGPGRSQPRGFVPRAEPRNGPPPGPPPDYRGRRFQRPGGFGFPGGRGPGPGPGGRFRYGR